MTRPTDALRRDAEEADYVPAAPENLSAARQRLAAWEARLARCVPCGGPAVEGTGLCEGCSR